MGFVDQFRREAWLTAVETHWGAEIQIVCDGTLWIHDCSSLQEALCYAVEQGWIRGAGALGVQYDSGSNAWTTDVQISEETLRTLGFRVGGFMN